MENTIPFHYVVSGNLATSTRDCESTRFTCHNNTCSRFDFNIERCMVVGNETTICKSTDHGHTRVYPSAHSSEIKLGPSNGALTQEVLCDHMTVIEQHRCQQNVNCEEVNSAGLQNAPTEESQYGLAHKPCDISAVFHPASVSTNEQVFIRPPPGCKCRGHWDLHRGIYALGQYWELDGEEVNSAEVCDAPAKYATSHRVSRTLKRQRSHHAEHTLEDGLVGILDCSPSVAFHSMPTCLYSFITTAAVEVLGLDTFETISPWAGQGLLGRHLDWFHHRELDPANIVIGQETTVPLSVYPCGSHGGKWERSGSYLMSEARIDVSPVCMHVIESKVPAIILGKTPSFEIRDFSNQHEDWILQDDGYELANGKRISKPQGYRHLGPVDMKGKPPHSKAKPNAHDLWVYGYDIYDWFPESSDDEATESEGSYSNSCGYAHMMVNDTHADTAVNDNPQPAPNAKASIKAEREARKAKTIPHTPSPTIEEDDEVTIIAVKKAPAPARAKRKFKGHGWSKVTKASRRARHKPLAIGDKLECCKPLIEPKAEYIRVTRAHDNADCNTYLDWRMKEKRHIRLSQPEIPEAHQSPLVAPKPKAFIPFDKDGPKVKVTMWREYAQGLETVLPLPEACPSAVISREPKSEQSEGSTCEDSNTSDDASEVLTKQSIRIPGTNLIIQIKCISQALVGGRKQTVAVLDSGASDHLSPVVPGLLSAAPISSIHGLSDEGTPPVTGMGKIGAVENVMWCPGTTLRLLSVGSLLDQLHGKITFSKTSAHHRSANGKVTPIASRKGHGLYVVTNAKYALGSNDASAEALVDNSVSTDVARERITALHRAFGHASKEVLRTLVKQHVFIGISEAHIKLLQPCDACLLGKSQRRHHEEKNHNTRAKLSDTVYVLTAVGLSERNPLPASCTLTLFHLSTVSGCSLTLFRLSTVSVCSLTLFRLSDVSGVTTIPAGHGRYLWHPLI